MNSTSTTQDIFGYEDHDPDPGKCLTTKHYVAFGFLGCLLAVFLYTFYLICFKSDYSSKKVGVVRLSPEVPSWLYNENLFPFVIVKNGIRGIRVEYLLNILKRTMAENRPFVHSINLFSKLGAWLDSALDENVGKRWLWWKSIFSYSEIDKESCVVSVPMPEFKCGDSCTEFLPISGMTPNSFFAYQMCGYEKIQVTFYIEGEIAKVAGYCIYVENHKDSASDYNSMHIRKCYDEPNRIVAEMVFENRAKLRKIEENLLDVFSKELQLSLSNHLELMSEHCAEFEKQAHLSGSIPTPPFVRSQYFEQIVKPLFMNNPPRYQEKVKIEDWI